MKYRFRFNKSAGQPGRGTVDHKWRVFDETGKEFLCKNIVIDVKCQSEQQAGSEDWNMTCEGEMKIDRENSVITII
jgi:hypothetical protein